MAFLTIPDSIAGRSLLDIYQDIGYEAEYILPPRSHNLEVMVAIVFRYADEVTLSDAEGDGQLPTDFDNHVYLSDPGTTCSPCSESSG